MLKIIKEPISVMDGKVHIAFAEDPSGYQWELI